MGLSARVGGCVIILTTQGVQMAACALQTSSCGQGLDLIGDLAAGGTEDPGTVVADAPGHACTPRWCSGNARPLGVGLAML